MTLPLFERSAIEVDDANRDSWCTPLEVVEALLRLWPGGIDLDPCSNSRSIVPARTRWDIADDGLARPWFGHVYCNPGYSRGVTAAFFDRCRVPPCEDVVGCCLCDPSVGWWSQHVWRADAVCFPDHRVDFIPPPDVKADGFNRAVALPYWGTEIDAFKETFAPLGRVVLLERKS
jgi:hypothetical protein